MISGHEALTFYTAGEQAGAKPKMPLNWTRIADPRHPEKFMAWQPPPGDRRTAALKTVRLYRS